MSKIKILHIGLTGNLGGISLYQKNLFDGIDREKYQLDFVTPYKTNVLAPHFTESGATVYFLPNEKTVFPYLFSLIKIIKNGKYDIVHIHKNSCANPLALMAADLAGVKTIIIHSHNTSPSVGKKAIFLHKLFCPYVCQKSHIHLACSEIAGRWLFGTNDNVTIVKNGINIDRFTYSEKTRNEVRHEFNIKDNEILIGHVGNSIPQKNHIFMLEILEKAVKINPNVKMMFIGCGSKMAEYESLAQAKNLTENVIFTGTRTDTNRLYQGMDLFLFPSLHEGLPISVIEAQASGVCCLISNRITKEVIVSDAVTEMSLDASAEEWAKKAIFLAKNSIRIHAVESIINAGYDYKQSTLTVEKIYADAVKRQI